MLMNRLGDFITSDLTLIGVEALLQVNFWSSYLQVVIRVCSLSLTNPICPGLFELQRLMWLSESAQPKVYLVADVCVAVCWQLENWILNLIETVDWDKSTKPSGMLYFLQFSNQTLPRITVCKGTLTILLSSVVCPGLSLIWNQPSGRKFILDGISF